MAHGFCVVALLGCGMVFGQTPDSLKTSTNPPQSARALAFDVVSIRQNLSDSSVYMGPPKYGPTADGYRATNMSLTLPIITAYVPTVGSAAYTDDHITGLPDWAKRDRFDIDAKVAGEDMLQWQKPAGQAAMLRAMLQALLTERCKLAVHRELKEVPVYSLVLAKSGPRLKLTNPDETHEGVKLPFGGIIGQGKDQGTLQFFATPMSSFATVLSSMFGAGRPIQDKTGLTGEYDIVLKLGDGIVVGNPTSRDATAASDPGGSIGSLVSSLGLKLESAKGQVETLVIDYIERPSAD